MAADPIVVIVAVLTSVLLAGAAFLLGRRLERRARDESGRTAAQRAEDVLASAKREAEGLQQQAVLAAKEEQIRLREVFERDVGRRRDDLAGRERRMDEREASIDRKLSEVEKREQEIQQQIERAHQRERSVNDQEAEVKRLVREERHRLEQLAGLSAAEAKAELIDTIADEARADAAARVRDIKDEARKEAHREAKKIVALAIQRIAAEHTVENTVSAVALPNDEMKGRIIGREGRNIRAFETATGADVIIDDTPDTVVVSCFDSVRREVACRALERLISDGRIHPGRIEEVVRKVNAEVHREIAEVGEEAVYDLGIHGMHAELVKMVGRMKYRTSYGQNLLDHSKEVAWIAGILASELRLDARLAKRGALLHDVGKVLTHEHEGTHVQLGVEMAKKYGEPETIVNCIAAHHDDVPHESPISVLVQAADAISGSRPGARREAFETYVKRLTRLEEIASEFDGVEKSYAIQAGREVRVMVAPDSVGDDAAAELSEAIARRLEGELQYPGQIKVVVIRETRAVEFAK